MFSDLTKVLELHIQDKCMYIQKNHNNMSVIMECSNKY